MSTFCPCASEWDKTFTQFFRRLQQSRNVLPRGILLPFYSPSVFYPCYFKPYSISVSIIVWFSAESPRHKGAPDSVNALWNLDSEQLWERVLAPLIGPAVCDISVEEFVSNQELCESRIYSIFSLIALRIMNHCIAKWPLRSLSSPKHELKNQR